MNMITRQHIVGMKYKEYENDNEQEDVLGFLTTLGFHLRKGI